MSGAPPEVERGGRSPLDITLAYHERSKHLPFAFAPALGYMDWDTQPDPFRRFEGAPVLPLDLLEVGREPRYEAAFTPGLIAPAPLDRLSISRLFHDALALSAWKQAGTPRWADGCAGRRSTPRDASTVSVSRARRRP